MRLRTRSFYLLTGVRYHAILYKCTYCTQEYVQAPKYTLSMRKGTKIHFTHIFTEMFQGTLIHYMVYMYILYIEMCLDTIIDKIQNKSIHL